MVASCRQHWKWIRPSLRSVVNIVRRIASSTPIESDAPGVVAGERSLTPAPVVANQGSDPAPNSSTGPVLEFMEPEPRNPVAPGRAPLPGSAGYSAQSSTGRDRGSLDLTSRLENMDDVALYALLGPLLQNRPQLRASLLQAPAREERRPSAESKERTSSGAAEVVRASFNQARSARSSGGPSEREYRKGDLVYVFSNSAQRWCEGTVTQISIQATGKIPPGSVEVAFELGQKWIAPQDAQRILRARPS